MKFYLSVFWVRLCVGVTQVTINYVDPFGVKSEELKARLKKLEDVAERKAYQELVKDIAPQKDVQEPFSSYKDQLGFGKFWFTSILSTMWV